MTVARNLSALILASLLPAACSSAPAATHSPRSLKANQDWYVGHGDIPQAVDLDHVYDTSYIEYAAGVLGS